MSLINQMLQELDQRGAELSGTGAMSPAAHTISGAGLVSGAMPVPAPALRWHRMSKWLPGLIVLLALFLALAWYGRQHLWWNQRALNVEAKNIAPSVKQTTLPTLSPVLPSNNDAVTSSVTLPTTLALKLSADFDPDKIVQSEAASTGVKEPSEKRSNGAETLSASTVVATVPNNTANLNGGQSLPEKQAAQPAEKKTLLEKKTARYAVSSANTARVPTADKDGQAVAAKNAGAAPAPQWVKEVSPQQKAEGEYRQATVLQQQGRAAEAIQMLEQTLKTDPQHTAAFQLLIGLLIDNKRQDDAIRWLQQALQADSAQPRLAMILARLQVDKAQVGNAIDTLQRTLPQAGEQSDYLAFLAALLQREGRHKAAVDYYQRALKKNPQNAVWWMGMGISQQAEHHQAEALDAFRQAKAVGGLSNELLAFIDQRIAQLVR